ncbi:MAG: hypothetical protein RLZ14_1807 [Actinomycetota bacterium]
MNPGRVNVPPLVASLAAFVEAGVLSASEVHVADWVARATGVADPAVVLGAAVATWASQHGHACAALADLIEVMVREHAHEADLTDTAGVSAAAVRALPWPEVSQWVSALGAATAAVRVVQGPDRLPVLDEHPLVLWGDRLYLQRHWVDECTVAASLRARVAMPVGAALSPAAGEALANLLPPEVDGEPNLQRHAADIVLRNRVSLVVGGPGTGKTYSLARILAVLLHEAGGAVPLRVALAAPTGKAAARMHESIGAALAEPTIVQHVPEAVRQALQAAMPTTIHRLLGSAPPQRQRFRHDASNPLPHDVVVIDETSMVSLPLLARLLEAVRPDARVLLIGDPDQLESVELGAVLGDIVAVAAPPDGSAGSGPLAGAAVRLLRARRFEKGSPIALLADAVRAQLADDALRVLAAPPAPDATSSARLIEADAPRAPEVVEAVAAVVRPVVERVRAHALAGEAEAALDAAAEVRILCGHRVGQFGVSHWNGVVEGWLFGGSAPAQQWYPGRPLLVTRNDQRLGLSNGDTGVVVQRDQQVVAAFRVGGAVVEFNPVQLADVDTAFAMTVHKSQGSEYPTVVFVLPPASSPLATRELVYTGATRAKQQLVLVGNDAALRHALSVRSQRMTGLTAALR